MGCSAGQEEFWERRGGRRAHLGRMGGRPRPGCAWGEGTPWTAGSRPGGHGELQPLTENREPHVGGSGEEAAVLQILLAQTRAVPGGRGEGEGCSEWPPEPPGHPSEHSQKCQLASSPGGRLPGWASPAWGPVQSAGHPAGWPCSLSGGSAPPWRGMGALFWPHCRRHGLRQARSPVWHPGRPRPARVPHLPQRALYQLPGLLGPGFQDRGLTLHPQGAGSSPVGSQRFQHP